jgi:BirA family biotin operon repressor/biotin-[acetyl-CoA-carboxylase] ligase
VEVVQTEVMDFPQSRAVSPLLEYLDRPRSTNDELMQRATGEDAERWPDLAAVVSDNQTAGRGRLGREWLSPAGKSLAVSVLLRPVADDGGIVPIERFGWFPLLAGLAMTRAVSAVLPEPAALKWPNDVLIKGRKVCGILSELLPDARGVVVGAGLNVALTPEDLPTSTSTSLVIEGVESPDPDSVLAAYLTELSVLYRDFLANDSRSLASLRSEITAHCETIGRAVRVELPSNHQLLGTATAIDSAGRLVVETNTGITTVAAGDVTHLRY